MLDASVSACWAFTDGEHADADLAFFRIRTDEALVPSLWLLEVRNILVVNERSRRTTESETASFLQDVSRFRVRVDRRPDGNAVLRLA